ncbi:winged helix-turn-helix domain-containing protein [Candidatus Woesearchaeota archaeon]|nr:winged helix-turn-helix domain-containing protein [Candidatus Woesearchaeota archaeon]
MKRIEEVYREVLFQSIEKKNNSLTQSYLAKALNMSLSIVNLALRPLRKMNAISVKQRSLDIIDKRKILYYWASTRNLEKDIIYKTRVEKPVRKIEAEMPSGIVYAAYSAYKFKFKEVPADYSEVYVYSDDLEEIEKRFPKNNKTPNIFILKKDGNMKEMTTAQIFVDLWNLKEWYARNFLKAMEEKLNGILE